MPPEAASTVGVCLRRVSCVLYDVFGGGLPGTKMVGEVSLRQLYDAMYLRSEIVPCVIASVVRSLRSATLKVSISPPSGFFTVSGFSPCFLGLEEKLFHPPRPLRGA